MKSLRAWAVAVWATTFFQLTTPAPAAQEDRVTVERIHSELPLYTFDWKEIWPQNFSSGEDFGCSSRVAFGDWRFTPDSSTGSGGEHWERFTNYGVFHCAAIMRTADEQSTLQEARWVYGYFVRLGTAHKGSAIWELWALQKGIVPGSEYTLLARQPGEATIKRFTMLQQRCPAGTRLEAKGLDIWVTRYCAINSRTELLRLARKMLELPPLGVIEWITSDA